ncbi:MAG: oligosaccharide flippase family protein [Gemmatimonadaceae bacterium]|nr:oligosaccharide flippase family protein [Gemmatimonadaceae bacterium]
MTPPPRVVPARERLAALRHDLAPILATAGVRAYATLTGIAALALTARLLGPTGRGVVAGGTAWATLVAGLAHLSVAQVVVREAAREPGGPWLRAHFANVLLVGAVASLLGWCGVAIVHGATGGAAFGDLPLLALVVGQLLVPFLVLETFATTMLPAAGALASLNVAQLVNRTLAIVCLVALVAWARFGTIGALVATLAGQVVAGAIVVRRLRRAGGHASRVHPASLRTLLVGGAQLHLNAVGSVLLANADVLVVQQAQGAQATGLYQLAVQAAALPLVVSQAAQVVFYGRVGTLGPDAAWRATRRAMVAVVALVAVGALTAGVLAPWLVQLLAGDRFADTVPLLRLLLLGTVAQSFSMLMAPQWIGRGLFAAASGITLGLGVATYAALQLVVPAHGARGAAATVAVAHGVTLLVNVAFAVWITRRQRAAALPGA